MQAAPAIARSSSLEDTLRLALARMSSVKTLSLTSFTQTHTKDGLVLDAIVHMTWPPGMRQRRIRAQGPSAQTALRALHREIATRFDIPDPDASPLLL